jgi:hypothetical protein
MREAAGRVEWQSLCPNLSLDKISPRLVKRGDYVTGRFTHLYQATLGFVVSRPLTRSLLKMVDGTQISRVNFPAKGRQPARLERSPSCTKPGERRKS